MSEYTGRVVGDKVTYECNEGFGFGPGTRMSRTCKEDRSWTTENIYCVLGQIAMMHMLLYIIVIKIYNFSLVFGAEISI